MPGTAGTPKGTTAFFGTFTASLIPVLCSPWVSLPPPCECRCQTCTTATSSLRSQAGWCPRNPASGPAPGSCLPGKDTSAATHTLPRLSYKALHRADSHLCKGLPQALWVHNKQEMPVCFLGSTSLYRSLRCCCESLPVRHCLPPSPRPAKVWRTFSCCPQQLSGAGM